MLSYLNGIEFWRHFSWYTVYTYFIILAEWPRPNVITAKLVVNGRMISTTVICTF